MTDAKTAVAVWEIIGEESHDLSRCSLCGAQRIALDGGRFGVCTLIGCKAPDHDLEMEMRLADHDATLAQAVREQCAQVADNLVGEFDLPDGVSAAGARKAQRIAREIQALPLPDADRRDEHDLASIAAATASALAAVGHADRAAELTATVAKDALAKHDERIRLEARLEQLRAAGRWLKRLMMYQPSCSQAKHDFVECSRWLHEQQAELEHGKRPEGK